MTAMDQPPAVPLAGAVTDAVTGAVTGADGLLRPSWAAVDPLLRDYYDTEWGLPVRDEQGLYERISLEAFQAGLSWVTILRKRPAFRAAFADFHPDTVGRLHRAGCRATARRRRNRAQPGEDPRDDHQCERHHRPPRPRRPRRLRLVVQPESTPEPRSLGEIPTQSAESIALSKALRKQGFAFVGPTTMHALMEAIGMIDTHLIDSHRRGSSGVWPR